ncbi:MAG: hypothetical protein HYV09_00595 [Deltaproteobacteria bacterium]|nr:hypothetical protein [Deltaproteobacteria bacterium]
MLRPRSAPEGARIVLSALLLSGCEPGPASTTRPVEVRGLPACPPKSPYARPIVVRLDRDRALFEEAFTVMTRVDAPTATVALSVPRVRMRATVRAGLCAPTSVSTWDCAAATWVASTTVDLDARSTPVTVTLPAFQAACAGRQP